MFGGQRPPRRGTVFTIEERDNRTVMQIWVQIPGGERFDREAVFVVFDGTLENVFKDSVVLVYGRGDGTVEGTNAFGGTVTQPKIVAEFVRF
jgi:hypothetical protein